MKKIAALLMAASLTAPSAVSAAEGVLFFSPERGSYQIDSEFDVEVRANTDGQGAFAAEADISFNPQSLAVQSISTDGSVLSAWPTPPEFSNTKGTIRFSGTGGTSFTGSDAPLITIRFRAIGVTAADMRFDSGAILENNARAMNIITSMRSALFTVTARQAAPAPQTAGAASTTVETPEVKGASIQVPSITGYDGMVSIGERIVVYGTGTPDSPITVYVQHGENTPLEGTVFTTRDGTFTYVARDRAEAGMYRVWAEARTDAERFVSDKVTIVAKSEGFAAAAQTLVPLLTVGIVFLGSLIAAGLTFGYVYNRRAAQK